jgi:hypothetical protein
MGVCPRRALPPSPGQAATLPDPGTQLPVELQAPEFTTRRHLKMTRTCWMRFTTNPLFATGGWTTSSAMTCSCQGRHNGFFHRADVVDRGGYRRNSNSSPVGVS